MSYLVAWKIGPAEGTIDDEQGETLLFATAEEANAAARNEFATRSVLGGTPHETLTKGLLHLRDAAPVGCAVWVEPAFWDDEEAA